MSHVGDQLVPEAPTTTAQPLPALTASLAEVEETAQVGVPAERAVEWLRALAETWQQAEVPEARSELLHAIYERIVVAGREFVSGPSHACRPCPRSRPGAASCRGKIGAPDKCWTRVNHLSHPD